MSQNKSPLSPHLQVYKPQMTSILSITHRATGVALMFGLLMLTWLLIAAASGENAYNLFMAFAGSPIGLLVLFGWTVSLYYHLCNGIRHLIWDTGRLFKMRNAESAGLVVLLATFILTVGTWVCAYNS